MNITRIFALLPALALMACTTMPTGPGVLVLPGTAKSFEQFRADDYVCRQYSLAQVGGQTPGQVAVSSGIASAAVGTAIGAAAGAALGGGRGAAIGAGTGLVGGSLVGTGAASSSGDEAQERYDVAYIQCMYAKGNRVPVSGNFTDGSGQESPTSTAPAQRTFPPPPPPPPSSR